MKSSPFLAHLSHWLMMSYCDHWMSVMCCASSVVRRQQLLQRTTFLKLLAGFLPNFVGMILIMALFDNCSNGSGPLHRLIQLIAQFPMWPSSKSRHSVIANYISAVIFKKNNNIFCFCFVV